MVLYIWHYGKYMTVNAEIIGTLRASLAVHLHIIHQNRGVVWRYNWYKSVISMK